MDLNDYREKRGLSYGKLGKQIGFSKAYTWKICQRPEILRIRDINKIIAIVGNEVDFKSLIKEA